MSSTDNKNDDFYKALVAFAETYNQALKVLNSQTLNYFAGDEMRKSIKALTGAFNNVVQEEILAKAMKESLLPITNAYVELLGSY